MKYYMDFIDVPKFCILWTVHKLTDGWQPWWQTNVVRNGVSENSQ